MKRLMIVVSILIFALPLAAPSGFAEEAYEKYRFSLTVNNFSTSDELVTNADNVSFFDNELGGVTQVDDPRPDSAVRNKATVKDDFRYDFQVSYGLLKWKWGELTLDSAIGYFKSDLGDLEVAVESDNDLPVGDRDELTLYHLRYVPIGKVTEVPVQIGGTVRFRPRKALSPYIGAGVGYIFASIDSTAEFDRFSKNVASSVGSYSFATGHGASQLGTPHRLKAAEVATPDSFEYHTNAGLEYTFAKGLSAVINGSWMWATKEIDITIDGQHSFGQQIPNGVTKFEYPKKGLPVSIFQGGLIDLTNPGTGVGACDTADGRHRLCPQDGVPDTGRYYAQGGTLRYSGFEVGVGIRYQF